MANVPPELSVLGLDVSRFRMFGNEAHGPCPRCGGSDRFVIFVDRPWPHWNWWCRQCHPQTGWADELAPAITKEIDESFRLEIERRKSLREEHERVERQRVLERFTTVQLWEELHRRMTEENYRWWEGQGIPREWADYWRFGFEPKKTFNLNGELFTCPAYTLPKFDYGKKFVNMDYRLIGAPDCAGKYRMIKDLPAAAFVSNPGKKENDDEMFVVEGSKKAAVVSIRGRDKSFLQVIGVPSCNSWAGWEERLKKCGRVWIIFDPDAMEWAHKFGKAIGNHARIVELPVKPDDALIRFKMTKDMFAMSLRQAVMP